MIINERNIIFQGFIFVFQLDKDINNETTNTIKLLTTMSYQG